MSPNAPASENPFHLLARTSVLRRFIVLSAASELSSQILNVAVGWYVYAITHSAMSLAYVGLAQFLPSIALVLIAGHAADRYSRRLVVGSSLFVQFAAVVAFAVWYTFTGNHAHNAVPVYALLVILGSARSFSSPAMSALLPGLVSGEEFPRAVALSTSAFQICTIFGPAVGGFLYASSGRAAFAAPASLYFLACLAALRLTPARSILQPQNADLTEKGVLGGFRYIRSNRLLLSLISLDLFAVLLGGVSALLPIYAKDILATGPIGLGWLRCAPGIGAAIVGVLLSHRTIDHSAGKRMLVCVAGFGAATIVFAVSRSFWLSLTALVVAGAFDMVSMVIRHTMLQISTPDAMRGRVSAVNSLFIGASAELGEFESGLTAALFGAVPAAILGGLGTIAIVGLWALIFPELRAADELVVAETSSSVAN